MRRSQGTFYRCVYMVTICYNPQNCRHTQTSSHRAFILIWICVQRLIKGIRECTHVKPLSVVV